MYCRIAPRVVLALAVLAMMYVCVQACPLHDRLMRLQRMRQQQKSQRLQAARNSAMNRVSAGVGRQTSGHTHNHAGHGHRPAPVSSSRRVYQRRPVTTTNQRVYYPQNVVNGNQGHVGSYYVQPSEHVPCRGSSVYFCPVGSVCQRQYDGSSPYRCIYQTRPVANCGDGFQRVKISSSYSTCRDINECADDDLNNCEHSCHNSHGSYTCRCRSGFSLHSNGSCTDIDECRSTSSCQHECHNTEGSYTCSCPEGYNYREYDRSCRDINECDSPSICRTDEKCLNLHGGYECYGPKPCDFGYNRTQGDPFGLCIISLHDFANASLPISISNFRYGLRNNFPAAAEIGRMNFRHPISDFWVMDGEEDFRVYLNRKRTKLTMTSNKVLARPRKVYSLNIAFQSSSGAMSWLMMDFVISAFSF